jgi:8-oxo-dGTP diphosphatase
VRDGKVLLGRRRNEPYKGEIDIIGGFMEADETPEEAAIREAKEETGLDVKITSLVGMYNGQYGEGGDHVLDILYTGEPVGGEPKPMDDISRLEWIDIDSAPLDSGSPNTRAGIRDLQRFYKQRKV